MARLGVRPCTACYFLLCASCAPTAALNAQIGVLTGRKAFLVKCVLVVPQNVSFLSEEWRVGSGEWGEESGECVCGAVAGTEHPS